MLTFNCRSHRRSTVGGQSISRSFQPSLEMLERREVLSAAYISDLDGDLFTVDQETGTTDHVGRMGEVMNDLALDPSGDLWGVGRDTVGGFGGAHTKLFQIDPNNAKVNSAGKLPTVFAGLGSRGSELFGATRAGGLGVGTTILRVNPDKRDGRGSVGLEEVYQLPDNHVVAGDLTFDTDGNLYLTTSSGDVVKVSSDFNSHTVVASTGLEVLGGVVYSDGSLYAYQTSDLSGDGAEVIHQIDPATGETAKVASITSPDVQGVPGAAPAPSGDGTTANDMYVWDIFFDSRVRGNGKFHDERVSVEVSQDANGNAESGDGPVANASLTVELRRESDGNDGPTGGDQLIATLQGVTGDQGLFTSGWFKDLPDGTYWAEVTELGHDALTWNQSLDPTSDRDDTDVDRDNLPEQRHSVGHSTAVNLARAVRPDDTTLTTNHARVTDKLTPSDLEGIYSLTRSNAPERVAVNVGQLAQRVAVQTGAKNYPADRRRTVASYEVEIEAVDRLFIHLEDNPVEEDLFVLPALV